MKKAFLILLLISVTLFSAQKVTLQLSWLHQFEDDGASITANFINYEASSFRVTSLAPVDDQGLLSLGLTSEYGQNISLFLNCAFALADGYTSNQLSGGLNWKF